MYKSYKERIVMLESWVKLLVGIRERIEIVDVRGSTTPD